MSVRDKINYLLRRKKEKSTEPNKEEKIAENRRKLHEVKGNKPFEANHMAHEFGLDDCIYILVIHTIKIKI